MKKLLAYLLLLSLLIISVSACSKKDDPPASSSVNTYRAALLLRADAGSRNVTLDWHMESLAETYNIYWIEDTGNAYNITNPPHTSTMEAGHKITSLISAPYILTGLTNGTTYWFSISGVNSSGESQLEQPTYAVPTSPAPPVAPENVRANAGNANVIVTWDEVSGATSYNLYYEKLYSDLTGWKGPYVISGVTSPYSGPYTDIPIVNSTDAVTVIYMFWVTALNGSSESSGSFAVRATPSATPPPMAPVLTSATTGSSSSQQIILAWTAPTHTGTGTLNYIIYYGTAKGVTKNTGTVLDAGDALTGYMTYLTSGTRYYFVITATDGNGESAESNEKSAVAY